MKFKNLMIVGLLLAILTIGAVSASEEVNSMDTLTAENMDEVSIDASFDEIASDDTEQALESGDAEALSVGNNTLVPNLNVSVSDVEYGEPAVVNMAFEHNIGPNEGNFLVNLDGVNYNVGFQNYAASLTFDDLDVGTHEVTVTYSGDNQWSSTTETTSFEVFESVEPGSYFDVNSDLITFREIVTLLHSEVGDDATGILTIRNKDIPEVVFFRKNISEMEYNYQMKGYKYDQYDGYVVFKEDLENVTTGQYDFDISYEENGRIIDSVETSVYLDFESWCIDGETDINKDEDIVKIHIPEYCTNGALILSFGDLAYLYEAGDPYHMRYKVINITPEMLGTTLTFNRTYLSLMGATTFSLDARYLSYDEFNLVYYYVYPLDEFENIHYIGITNGTFLYAQYIGDDEDEHGHYEFYWKTRFLQDNDFVIVVDNTKFRANVESTSILDENGKLWVYCPEDEVGRNITIEANDHDIKYKITDQDGGNYIAFNLSSFEIVEPGEYQFKINDINNKPLCNICTHTFENPISLTERAIIGADDKFDSVVVYVIVPDGTEGSVEIKDEEGNSLFTGDIEYLNLVTDREQIDYQFEDDSLNRYYVLQNQLIKRQHGMNTTILLPLDAGNYNLNAILTTGGKTFTSNGEVRFVERKYEENDEVIIELFDYEEHRFCDEEDCIAKVTAKEGYDPSDDYRIEVNLIGENDDKIYNFSLEEDDGCYSVNIWIDDDEMEPGEYEVIVSYYSSENDDEPFELSSFMTFVDRDDEEDGPINDLEFCPPEPEEEFEIGDNVVVAYLYIPESWDDDVNIYLYRGDELLYTENTANINYGYDNIKEAREYPIALDLTQLNNEDIIRFMFDYWGDSVFWAEAVQVVGGKVIFWDDPDFERLEFTSFYGNLTTGTFNSPDIMGPHFDGRAIIMTISDSWGIDDATITVSDGETTFFTKKLSEIDDKYYDFRSLGYEYAIHLDEFNLMTLPENTNIFFTFTSGDITLTQKRVRIGDYMSIVIMPTDVAPLFDVQITDVTPFDALNNDDPIASIVATDDANRQSVLLDLGGGQFNVYVDGEKVEGLGQKVLENWIRNSDILDTDEDEYLEELGINPDEFYELDEDEKIAFLQNMFADDFGNDIDLFRICSNHEGWRELLLSAQDLGITENGKYNIKITHISAPDEEPDPDYLPDNIFDCGETVVSEKDVTVMFEPLDTVLAGEDLEMKYKDGSAWEVCLTDIYGNTINGVNVGFSILGKTYYLKTDDDGIARLTINLNPGTYALSATFDGNDIYNSASVSANVIVTKSSPILTVSNAVMEPKAGSIWTVNLTFGNGDPIANANIKVGISGKNYTIKTNATGVAGLPINLVVGVYNVSVYYAGSSKIDSASANSAIVVKYNTILTADDLEMNYKDGSAWTVTLKDANGNALSNIYVKFGIAGKVYKIKTDSEGVARLPINLAVGVYEVNATFDGGSSYAPAFVNATVYVNKYPAVLTAADVVMTYKDGSAYSVTLKDANGNVIVDNSVQVTIKGKSYNLKTDENGVASLPINLAPGTYEISASTDNNSYYGAERITNIIRVNPA